MTEKQREVVATLRKTLEGCLGVNFDHRIEGDDMYAISSLEQAIEQNTKEIDARLNIIAFACQMNFPAIEELSHLNDQMEARLKELKSLGERNPIPIEHRSPSRNKAG